MPDLLIIIRNRPVGGEISARCRIHYCHTPPFSFIVIILRDFVLNIAVRLKITKYHIGIGIAVIAEQKRLVKVAEYLRVFRLYFSRNKLLQRLS